MFFFQNWFVQVKFHPPFLMLTIKTNTKAQLCASQFCASQFNPPLPHADKKTDQRHACHLLCPLFFVCEDWYVQVNFILHSSC